MKLERPGRALGRNCGPIALIAGASAKRPTRTIRRKQQRLLHRRKGALFVCQHPSENVGRNEELLSNIYYICNTINNLYR
jgi:hypothetical protein